MKRPDSGAAVEVALQIGRYDTRRPLVIDPVLSYFTDETSCISGTGTLSLSTEKATLRSLPESDDQPRCSRYSPVCRGHLPVAPYAGIAGGKTKQKPGDAYCHFAGVS